MIILIEFFMLIMLIEFINDQVDDVYDYDVDVFAGSAAIGHLLLSEHTYSHFAQVTQYALLETFFFKTVFCLP